MSELARQLIAENQRTHALSLDLGNCGLTTLPDELFTLTWLVELNLGIYYLDKRTNEYSKSKNGGSSNKLTSSSLYKLMLLTQLQTLHLSKNRLTSVSFLEGLTQLHTLHLRNNDLTKVSFPEGLTQLRTLDLSDNQLTNVSSLQGLTHLHTLYLSKNKLTNASFLMQGLTRLQTLDLSNNDLNDVSFLQGLTQLQTLHLRYNLLTNVSFPEGLTQLQTLDLHNNLLTNVSIPEGLTQLHTLDLSENRLTNVRFLQGLTQLHTLDLSENKLTNVSIPEGLAQLHTLRLDHNRLTSVSSLQGLTQLHTLHLHNNLLTNVSSLEELAKLQTLDLRNNRLTGVDSLQGLTQLHTLHLHNNLLTNVSIPEGLTRLQTLDLSENKLTNVSFPEGLTQLQTLHLSKNQLTNVSSLQGLTRLHTLDLSENRLTNASFLQGLTQLHTLHLSKNNLTDVSFLQGLTQLHTLHLNHNQLTNVSFPEGLTRLQTLDLSHNDLTNVSFLQGLTQLQTLDLNHNQLTNASFPEGLTQLHRLHLNYNQLTNVSFPEGLTRLQTLDLSHNDLTNVSFLQGLTQLQTLDLNYNKLTNVSFPEGLTLLHTLHLNHNQLTNASFLQGLTQLHTLHLNHNQLTNASFPEGLTRLKTLDLSNNNLTNVSFLQGLTQLQTLHLSNNEINVFPERFLLSLPLLKQLYIHGNRINNIPKEHFEGTNRNALANIRAYFASIKQGSIQNDEVKLIVVGNTTAGKTSLLRFVRESQYEQAENSTHGIALTRWPIPNSDLRVNIWDFGGQEYYHATHRLFLDDHAVYVVVWEADTNTDQILNTDIYLSGTQYSLLLEHFPYNYWLDSIRYYAPNSTILLVQNKTDKTGIQGVPDDCFKPTYSVHPPAHYLSIVQANDHKESLHNPSWSAYKAFEANLITSLKTDAARHKLGIGWVAIRDAIRLLPANQHSMEFAEFNHFCQQAAASATPPVKFDSAVEMSGLLTYLSGAASTVVYYGDDARLRNIVFLNPQWVTDTIYDILTYDIRDRRDKPGEFTRMHVEQVLNDKGIGHLTDTFLELMKKGRFELIFEKPNCPDEYIAPQYLPDQYPDHKALEQLRPESFINFTLRYPRYMPKSVFIRFMVRYGNLAKNVYWKYGIVLDKPSQRVVAECKFRERLITLQIVDNSQAKAKAQELFDTLWYLSDKKPDIEVSVNGTDFVEIGELIDCFNDKETTRIKSKEGNRLYIKDFQHLFSKEPIVEHEHMNPLSNVPNVTTPEIFFSYAWSDNNDAGESREKIVDELYESLKNDGYQVVRDKMDLGYKGLISNFIKRIGKGQIVIVAISDKYLKSPYCMFELLEIYRNARLEKDEFVKVIFPIRVESIALNKPAVPK